MSAGAVAGLGGIGAAMAIFGGLFIWALRRGVQERARALQAAGPIRRFACAQGWTFSEPAGAMLWRVSHGDWELNWSAGDSDNAARLTFTAAQPAPDRLPVVILSRQALGNWQGPGGKVSLTLATLLMTALWPEQGRKVQTIKKLLQTQPLPLTGAWLLLGATPAQKQQLEQSGAAEALRVLPATDQAWQRCSAGWNARGVQITVPEPTVSVELVAQVVRLGLALIRCL